MGSPATNFLVVVLFLGLSDGGLLSCFWSFSFSFSSCVTSFSSCLICWSIEVLGFRVVMVCAFWLMNHINTSEVADRVQKRVVMELPLVKVGF